MSVVSVRLPHACVCRLQKITSPCLGTGPGPAFRKPGVSTLGGYIKRTYTTCTCEFVVLKVKVHVGAEVEVDGSRCTRGVKIALEGGGSSLALFSENSRGAGR
eukprot:INCI312.1.p2 GENE.INCI312.1~~INCI312.1.p2  ORF type:complete len:103 (-),score=0.02 INCI312.1:118-426(-)